MQFTSLLSIIALVGVSAAQYTGPCTASACGASSEVCGTGLLCVPFPSFDVLTRQGCACSGKKKSPSPPVLFVVARWLTVALAEV